MSASRRPLPASQKAPAVPKRAPVGRLQRWLTAYGTRHAQAALLSLGQISRAPFSTLLICLVMGIALALPTGLFILLKNTGALNQQWDSRSPVTLYLKMSTTDADAQTLVKQIAARTEVEKVDYISSDTGLAEFEKQMGLGSALNSLKQNPLPAVLVVTPRPDKQNPAEVAQLRDSLQTLPQVDMAKLDLDWVQRLDALLTLAKKLVYTLAVLFSFGVVLIVGSTIHLALQSHHDEIVVYKLLGATKGFIRRPFLYRGISYGLAASIVAELVVVVVLYWLNQPVMQLAKLYGSTFALQGLGFSGCVYVVLLGMALGWLGAWIAMYRHSAQIV
jgi:cell division transport system permease protein